MMQNSEVVDNRFHVRLKRHFIKHGKRLKAHIKKHHKKYLFGGTIYGVSHLIILKVLALKLLLLKLVTAGLALVGIMNPSLTDIFAKMENICVNNHSIIAQQTCEKNFGSIQDAVNYLESTINPETDTIYNAQYYGIIKSLLGNYCDKQIDKDAINAETKKINDIDQQKDSSEKIYTLETAHNLWKQKTLENNLGSEKEFCETKYLAYDMLDLSQSLFLKEVKKEWLLTPVPMSFWQKITNASDSLVLSWFAQRIQDIDTTDIKYTLKDLGNTKTNTMAHIIKNISVSAANDALNTLHTMNILTNDEIKTIKDKLELRFVESCGDNKWYHKINQYYGDNDVLQNTTLEEIKLDIPLCDSYQYIDQLNTQVKKLLLHELGHYIYYFKDKSTNAFESLCRSSDGKTTKNVCTSDEFVSAYAQTSTEEDYAETFSRWALTKIDKNKQYLAYYRETPIVLAAFSWDLHMSAVPYTDNMLIKKFSYFDTLLPKIRGK